jgi:hypothetical protein
MFFVDFSRADEQEDADQNELFAMVYQKSERDRWIVVVRVTKPLTLK